MKPLALAGLVLAGCGSVQTAADAALADVPADTRPVDAQPDGPDLSPRVVFVTSTSHSGNLGGLAGADAICQARAQAVNLPGMYKAWLADANLAPATRMTRHAGPYQLVTGTVIAQGWTDLTDGTIATRVNRTEGGVLIGGPGCNPGPTCPFICEGGEVWSNVDAAGNRRAIVDCAGWTSSSNNVTGTAGNAGKTDALWTAGTCTPIICGSGLPLFCVQQ